MALLLALALSPLATSRMSWAQEAEAHHLAFASDYHDTEGSISSAMGGMPEDVEYVSLIGDMTGGMQERAPEYQSSTLLELVRDVFPHLDSSNVSIVWGSHDENVHDEGTDIVKCPDGYGSCPIYQGLNEDGSTAYYIYAIGYYEMQKGGSTSQTAAADFKSWVDGLDPSIPVIVLCHMPLQSKRGDNLGATYWNEALNYASTGVEGITSTDVTAEIQRNVVFLCAHNHTVSKDEFYFPAGGTMMVQVDTTNKTDDEADSSEGAENDQAVTPSDDSNPDKQPEDTRSPEGSDTSDAPETKEEAGQSESSAPSDESVSDPESGSEERPKKDYSKGPGSDHRPGRHHEAKGEPSNIYYTSLVAGYLKTDASATLMTIDAEHITLERYHEGETIALGVDGVSGEAVEGPVIIERVAGDAEEAELDMAA